MKVFVYYNLRRKMWSIKALEGENKNRVVDHAKCVYLTDVTSKVSEAGRQRVLRTKQKNVHAGLVGYIVLSADSPLPEFESMTGDEVTYNPYKFRTFVKKPNPTEEMVHADFAAMVDRRVTCFRLETKESHCESHID